MKYEIFQIRISNRVYDEVNRLDSHDAAAKVFPEYEAHLAVSFYGSEKFEPRFLKHYDKVAEVECEDLEDVFEIGNGHGDQSKLTRLERMHSVSVGDIVRLDTGRYMMVDGMGFNEVSIRG